LLNHVSIRFDDRGGLSIFDVAKAIAEATYGFAALRFDELKEHS
jgi:hypothetical protein